MVINHDLTPKTISLVVCLTVFRSLPKLPSKCLLCSPKLMTMMVGGGISDDDDGVDEEEEEEEDGGGE